MEKAVAAFWFCRRKVAKSKFLFPNVQNLRVLSAKISELLMFSENGHTIGKLPHA